MEEKGLSYDGQVAVITGAGNGLGKQYALYFASNGAKVVVNDLGGNIKGSKGNDTRVADVVVEKIRQLGGTAVPNYDPVQNGANIIHTAIQHFGRVDILINNAGILRDTTLKNMKDEDWDILMEVHVLGTLRTTLAAWPHFLRQGHGRIVNTSSSSGIFGNFGQSNYATAKMAIFGFSKAVALEGADVNIHCNILAPSAASRLTATVWSPEMMEAMSPDWLVPLVGVLAHRSCQENGSAFLAGSGHFSKIRWEHSRGLELQRQLLQADEILRNHALISDWPISAQVSKTLEEADAPIAGHQPLVGSLQGHIALVAISSNGDERLRALVLHLQKSGAQVIIWSESINASVRGLNQTGVSVSTETNVEEMVQDILRTHGRLDILINHLSIEQSQEGLLRDLTGEKWAATFTTNIGRLFRLTRAVWPTFVKAKYGRVVNVLSPCGIDGSIGRTISSAAACGLIGFTKTTSREGQKYNIVVNAVAQAHQGSFSESTTAANVLVEALCSKYAPATGQLYETELNRIAVLRWQRSGGVDFEYADGVPSARAVAESLNRICDFDDGRADNPATPSEGSGHIHSKGTQSAKRVCQSSQTVWKKLTAGTIAQLQSRRQNSKFLDNISSAMRKSGEPTTFHYTDRDLMLYNLGVGAKATDLNLVFEKHGTFDVIPTFGVVPSYFATPPYSLADIVPNFKSSGLLHSEQVLDIKKWPLPRSGTLSSTSRLLEVLDIGKAALVRSETISTDERGDMVFRSQKVVFLRGSGGFGGPSNSSQASPTLDTTPSRPPEKRIEERTSEDLAALYRLLGDRNPVHVDPKSAKTSGFEKPILHGLATFGIVGKHIYRTYGLFRTIRVRFAGVVMPGQTLVTDMWKDGAQVVFCVTVKETGNICISHASATLSEGGPKL